MTAWLNDAVFDLDNKNTRLHTALLLEEERAFQLLILNFKGTLQQLQSKQDILRQQAELRRQQRVAKRQKLAKLPIVTEASAAAAGTSPSGAASAAPMHTPTSNAAAARGPPSAAAAVMAEKRRGDAFFNVAAALVESVSPVGSPTSKPTEASPSPPTSPLLPSELPGQAEKGEPRPVSSEGRPLPPVHKKGSRERDSVSSGAWKEMSEDMDVQMLSALACDRLVDGYLKTSRPPPQFLLRYEQILKAKVIDVSHAGLTDYHVAPLLALLQRSCEIQCLHLDSNSLTDQSALLLAELLCKCPTLTRLSLSWNAISSKGAQSLLDSLVECPKVVVLDLEGNKVSNQLIHKLDLQTTAHARKYDLPNSAIDALSRSLPMFTSLDSPVHIRRSLTPAPGHISLAEPMPSKHQRRHQAAAPLPTLSHPRAPSR
jgi:hypothetical protein